MNKYGLEARDNWIAARIEELLEENPAFTEFLLDFHSESQLRELCRQQAEREHASLTADLEDERINHHRRNHEF